MSSELTLDDIRKAVATLEATMPPMPDFYILLPQGEPIPEEVRKRWEEAGAKLYYSTNIEVYEHGK